MTDRELDGLRAEIGAIDRTLLDALNRRLELVRRVREHKDAIGARWFDAEREAELLRTLARENPGPLSERSVTAFFSAVLDLMKQELAAERPARPAAGAGPAPGVERLAVVGTGLLGASVGLAAKRAGVRSAAGFDAEAGVVAEARALGAVDRVGASLAETVAGAELVVVAVPVGTAAATVREALAAAAPDATVTDVSSTKRELAAIDDPRFVPGHPVAGGHTGGPRRAAADLFEGATWFLSPTAASEPARIERVERFVTALGARPARLDADAHDRLLALTSHLPHALANLLMRQVADADAAGEGPLAHAGASLREMTRVAGANATVWTDIFLANADEIAGALDEHGRGVAELERALRTGDRNHLERTIAEAAEARSRMLAYAYRTEAGQLNRIRVRVPDRPGVLAQITQILGAAGINIEDFELRHVSPEYGGVLVILVTGTDTANLARSLLRREGYSAA